MEAPTLPLVTVAFHSPAFSETEKDHAALELLFDLTLGPTSDLYKRLVEDEQRVDQLFPYVPPNVDPYLATAFARVKSPADAVNSHRVDRAWERKAASGIITISAIREAVCTQAISSGPALRPA